MELQKTRVLLSNKSLAAGEMKRLLPGLDVSKWDRLHFHISGGNRSVADLQVQIVFGTPVDKRVLLADSTIWFEDSVREHDFTHTVPSCYNGTGFVMSVPVIAPGLYDVILRNLGEKEKPDMYVTVMAQEV